MLYHIYGGPLDGQTMWSPPFRVWGPTNLNNSNLNYEFTRGGLSHYYCKTYTNPPGMIHFKTGPMPLRAEPAGMDVQKLGE